MTNGISPPGDRREGTAAVRLPDLSVEDVRRAWSEEERGHVKSQCEAGLAVSWEDAQLPGSCPGVNTEVALSLVLLWLFNKNMYANFISTSVCVCVNSDNRGSQTCGTHSRQQKRDRHVQQGA